MLRNWNYGGVFCFAMGGLMAVIVGGKIDSMLDGLAHVGIAAMLAVLTTGLIGLACYVATQHGRHKDVGIKDGF